MSNHYDPDIEEHKAYEALNASTALQLSKARATIERLEGALRLYGEHTPECGCWDKMDSGQLFARHDWQCTCGFREALDKEQT